MNIIIDITLRDQEKLTKTITINNMSLDLYKQLNNEDIINELFDYKYYLNTIYDKINILDFSFILNKQSKSSVTLMQIN